MFNVYSSKATVVQTTISLVRTCPLEQVPGSGEDCGFTDGVKPVSEEEEDQKARALDSSKHPDPDLASIILTPSPGTACRGYSVPLPPCTRIRAEAWEPGTKTRQCT